MPTTPIDPFEAAGGSFLPKEPAESDDSGLDPFAAAGGSATPPPSPQAQQPGPDQTDPFAAAGGAVASAPLPEPTPDPRRGLQAQIGQGVLSGLKEAVAPFAVTKEEMDRPKTGVETAASVTANLGVGLAAAGAGFAIAGPVGAAVASTMYGLYAGIGNEAMRSKANGEEFNYLRAAGQVGLEINPLLKTGGKAVRAMRAAAQVGGAVALERAYGTEDPLALGAAGVLQGAVPVILTKGFRPDREFAPPQAVAAATKALSKEAEDGLLARTTKAFNSLSKSELTPDATDQTFRRWVTGAAGGAEQAQVDEAFEELWKRSGEQARSEAWGRWKLDQVMVSEAEKLSAAQHNILTGRGMADPTSAVGRTLKDLQLVSNDVDEKVGTNMVGVIDSVSRSKEAFTMAAKQVYGLGVKARRLSRKLKGVRETSIGRALAAEWDKIPAGEATILRSEAGTKVLDAWRAAFEAGIKQVEAAGYEPGRIINYLPLQAMRGADLGLALERGVEQLQAKAAKYGVTSFKELAGKDDDAQKFLAFIAQKLKKPLDELDNKDILRAPRELMVDTKSGVGYDSTALHLRSGDLPEDLRELRPGELLATYINNNLKSMYMQDSFRQLNMHIRALDALGLAKTADFYRRYAADMSGISRGASTILHDAAERTRFWGRKVAEQGGLIGTTGKAAAAVPDLMAVAQAAVYPAYLGFNQRSTLRNLTQLWATTAPELGGMFGYKMAARGVMAAAKDVAGGTNPLQKLRGMGQMAGHVGEEAAQVLDPGRVSGNVRKAYDFYNNVAMMAYSATDTANRFLTYHTAREWSKDIIAGSEDAIKALSKMQRGVRESLLPEIETIIKDGNVDRLSALLGDYLISRTQFRYGKEQLNEFGRVMGPMVSMFSKWPVMVTSDIVNQFRHQGIKNGSFRVFEKYAAPYLLLSGVGAAVEEYTELGKQPWFQYLVGDVSSLSPAEAAFSWDLTGSPVLRAPAAILQTAKEGSTKGTHFAREALKVAPVVGPVINEVDRWYRATGRTSKSTQIINDATRRINQEFGGPLVPGTNPPKETK